MRRTTTTDPRCRNVPLVAISGIEQLLDPSFLEDVATLEMGQLRERRDLCQQASDTLSYLRRLVQGRLDLVHDELSGRASGTHRELSDIVEDLKRGEILGEGTRSEGMGRLPHSFSPADADGWITAELDILLPPDRLALLTEMSDEELREVAESLQRVERRVSDQRAELHRRTDAFQEEIVRRYRTGEASVESLLT